MTWSHFLPLFLFIQKDMFFIIISLFSQEKIVTLWQIKKHKKENIRRGYYGENLYNES